MVYNMNIITNLLNLEMNLRKIEITFKYRTEFTLVCGYILYPYYLN